MSLGALCERVDPQPHQKRLPHRSASVDAAQPVSVEASPGDKPGGRIPRELDKHRAPAHRERVGAECDVPMAPAGEGVASQVQLLGGAGQGSSKLSG